MPRKRRQPQPDYDDEPISPALARRLRRQTKDLKDPTRYVIVSAFAPRFLLYYDVRSGNYPMNDLSSATLFKRRAEAKAVAAILGRGHVLMTVRLSKSGAIKRITPLRELFLRRRKQAAGRTGSRS